MDLSPKTEADSHTAGQEVQYIVISPEVHYCVRRWTIHCGTHPYSLPKMVCSFHVSWL